MANKAELTPFTDDEVDEYLKRIRFTGSRTPTVDTLIELHQRHLMSIPFENLSLYGKEKIILSNDWLFKKLIQRKRGGFCFELNIMFSSLLHCFGFKLSTHAAQIFNHRTGNSNSGKSHMVIVVDIDGDQWLADVACGDNSVTPLRFKRFEQEPQEYETSNGIYRICKDGDMFSYEQKVRTIVDRDGHQVIANDLFTGVDYLGVQWAKQYRFDLTPQTMDHYQKWCVFHETQPSSPFQQGRLCTLAKPWGRITLSREKLVTTTYLGNNKVLKETKHLLGGEKEVVKELEDKFGIRKESCLYPPGSIYFRE